MAQTATNYRADEIDSAHYSVRRRRPSVAVSERRLLLVGLDALLLVVLAYVVAHREHGGGTSSTLALIMVGSWFVVGQLTGLYDLHTAARLRRCLQAVSRTAVAVALLLVVLFFSKPYFIARPKLVDLAIAGPVIIALWRISYVRFLGSRHFVRRVLVLGGGETCKTLVRAIRQTEGHGVSVVGIIDDDHRLHGTDVEGVPVIGDSTCIWAEVRKLGVEEVVLAVGNPTNESLFEGLVTCYERGIAVSLMPHLYEEVAGQVPVEHVGRHWLGAVPLSRPGGGVYEAVKRVMDVSVALIGIVLLFPVMIVLALTVRLTSPGSVLFRQKRVGLHGESFEIVKFRTMHSNAEGLGVALWATRDDPRVTGCGKLMRRMHLDELPQLFLVLNGKMSLVGPRPERPEFVSELEHMIALYAARYSVRPGITGWAQIQYPYGNSVQDALAKLRYDLYYVKHRSLLLDTRIVARTLVRVVRMRGL